METKVKINKEILKLLSPTSKDIIANIPNTGVSPNYTKISNLLEKPVSTVWDQWQKLNRMFDIEVTVEFKLK